MNDAITRNVCNFEYSVKRQGSVKLLLETRNEQYRFLREELSATIIIIIKLVQAKEMLKGKLVKYPN